MKKLTESQKKWALTATMIAALGCSVSFNPAKYAYTSDFASKEIDSDVVTTTLKVDDKVIDVQLVATGDNKTKVYMSPSKDAEGKARFECPSCNDMVIDKKLQGDGDNIRAIKADIVDKMISKTRDDKEKVASKEIRRDRPDVDDEREGRSARSGDRRERRSEEMTRAEQADTLYDEGNAGCLNANGENKFKGVKQVGCYATELAKSLKKHDGIEPRASIEYYQKYLEKTILKELNQWSFDPYDADEADLESNEGYKIIADLIKTIPKDHAALHEQLVYTTTKALERKGNEYRRLAADVRNIPAANQKFMEIVAYKNAIEHKNEMTFLDSKASNADIQTILYNAQVQQSDYLKALPLVGQQAPGMPIQVYTLQAPNSFNVPGFPTQAQQTQAYVPGSIPGMRPDGSVPAPGYGTNGQLLPNGQVLVNQNGQAMMVQPQQVVQQNGQVVLSPQMMTTTQSQGVLMGQPTLATPQTINAAGAQRQRVQW